MKLGTLDFCVGFVLSALLAYSLGTGAPGFIFNMAGWYAGIMIAEFTFNRK